MKCSAHTGEGVAEVWDAVERYRETLGRSGEIARRRANQARAWIWSEVTGTIRDRLGSDPRVGKTVAALEARVAAGKVTPTRAAKTILKAFLGD